MSAYDDLTRALPGAPRTWLVTGVAGFIGSHLLETLLRLDQRVVGLDNFSTGHQRNLDEVCAQVTPAQWARFTMRHGDVCALDDCRVAVAGVDYVLHQAALGSVPRSIEDPVATHASNITGFLHLLVAARDAGVRQVVYAASSSTYGDHPGLPKVEDAIGRPMSPYALTKLVDELYAEVFARTYGTRAIGLRYFNVFGPRQDPQGAYAAVIPAWTAALLRGDTVWVNGDGETSRDFCYVANVVQANLLAATTEDPAAINQVYNIALGDRTTLTDLYAAIRDALVPHRPNLTGRLPAYREFRAGDVRHSQADIGKARRLLGYAPTHRVAEGIAAAMDWYRSRLSGVASA